MAAGHYVYLYRSKAGKAMYVGYGRTVDRATSHPKISHNKGLRTWLERGEFSITVAGPYGSDKEGKHVEAALISALEPEFNRSPGDGPGFLPLGVPARLASRPRMQPLTVKEIGRTTGGALLVYLAPGDFLSDGRPKFDPAHPDDSVVLGNIEQAWALGSMIDRWSNRPDAGPQVLVGLYGRPSHRFVAGAIRIKPDGWSNPDLNVRRGRWKVPTVRGASLDAAHLRGRRVSDAHFGNWSHQLHIWIDKRGVVRYPAKSTNEAR